MVEQLSDGSYECMICTEDVTVKDQIWSCQTCYHVFHIKCIKKWATSANAKVKPDSESGISGFIIYFCILTIFIKLKNFFI